MKNLKRLCACALILAVTAGCASTEKTMETSYGKVPGFGDATLCVIGGAVAGGTAGALVGEVVGGVIGALSGAVMGDVLCNYEEAEQAAAMTMTDSDGDGVADDADACPNTPSGVAVDGAGCPLYTDADSVPDYLDQCPGTPSGVQVDDKGCPIVVAAAPVSIVTNINFDFNSAAIRDDARPKLDRVIALLEETPNVIVRVVGYTDSTGPEAYNSELSLRRAESVSEYMISRGIAANRVQAVGRGESNPLVPNTTDEGRAVNRRVEFEVVS